MPKHASAFDMKPKFIMHIAWARWRQRHDSLHHLICTLTDLVGLEAGEAEHADLVGDVLPVPARALLAQTVAQRRAHADDAVGHALHVLQPAGVTGQHINNTVQQDEKQVLVQSTNACEQVTKNTFLGTMTGNV